ncbi:MAG: MFS transporter [Burkholderiales bacterium PBB3]|nr:MAG: MFS transporter [Burkholderiales bacterium PBB3]
MSTSTAMASRQAIAVFAVFAFAYFFSTLIRAITATLAPTLVTEFALNARDLGLLAGGYFLGFAAMQLPLGSWLDRHGPRKVIVLFLTLAVAGCVAFSMATSFVGLLAARVLCGVGVCACLMAPLTGYRRWFAPASQIRANAWMLMVGAFGMVASTLPVQWLVPLVGWRAVFVGLGALVALAMLLIVWLVPQWERAPEQTDAATPGYAEVWASRYFRSLVPLGFFSYGGLVAMQTLWAAPWMVKVAGYTPLQAATGLFWINVAMLLAFWLWGLAMPALARRGLTVERMIALGLPLSFLVLAIIVIAGSELSTASAAVWALFCVSCTVGSFAQPAVGMAFRAELAGRALSAFNLVIFCGVFAVQWGVGLLIDGFQALGWAQVAAYQGAIGVYGLCCLASYAYFLWAKRP